MATRRAPTAPTKELERALPAPVEMTAVLLELLELDVVAVARPEDAPVPTGTVLLLPETPVAVDEEPVAVDEAPIPLPAPSEGESPEPEEATPELAAETRDEPALADADEAAAELELPLPPETAVELEDGATVEVESLLDELEDDEETSLQERSYRGVVP